MLNSRSPFYFESYDQMLKKDKERNEALFKSKFSENLIPKGEREYIKSGALGQTFTESVVNNAEYKLKPNNAYNSWLRGNEAYNKNQGESLYDEMDEMELEEKRRERAKVETTAKAILPKEENAGKNLLYKTEVEKAKDDMLRQKAYETWSKSPYERMHEETERMKETLDLPRETSSNIIKSEKEGENFHYKTETEKAKEDKLYQKAYETWSKSPYERMLEETEKLKKTFDLPKETSSDKMDVSRRMDDYEVLPKKYLEDSINSWKDTTISTARNDKINSKIEDWASEYNKDNIAGKQEKYVEKSDLREEGDANLSELTNYIINGEVNGDGGLCAQFNKGNFIDKIKIRMLAKGLREKNFSYNMKSVEKAYLMLDENGADLLGEKHAFGHTAVFLVNKEGEGIYFSYGLEGFNFLGGRGEMAIKTMNQADTKAFLKNKTISESYTSLRQDEDKTYHRMIEYSVTPIEGESMIKRAIDYFVSPGKYNILFNQCNEVAGEILAAGNIDYKSEIIPKLSFEDEETRRAMK